LPATDELYEKVVREGLHRRRRWLALVGTAMIAGGVLIAISMLDSDDRDGVVAAGPSTTSATSGVGPIELPGENGSRGVSVLEELRAMPAEAAVWTARRITAGDVEELTEAIGVGGTARRTAEGFRVTGGHVDITVVDDPVVGWRFDVLSSCDPGVCIVPDGPEAAPEPEIERRPEGLEFPDDPPPETASTAVATAQRVAGHLGAVATRIGPGLNEWHAELSWMVGDASASSSFGLAIRPDGSIRSGSGQLTRPGERVRDVRLVGVLEGLHRLISPREHGPSTTRSPEGAQAAPGGRSFNCGSECPPITVTDVILGYTYVEGRFEPSYWFTTPDGVTQVRAT
jgi:hypothetical protein